MVRRLTDLRYVHAFIDRTGRARFYFRRFGKRTPLPGVPGSREFLEAYAGCLEDQRPSRAPRTTAVDGTMAALATLYYRSPQYLKLSSSSRINYRRVIDQFLSEHGHRRVDQMRREHVDTIIGRLANKPGAAIVLLKRLRTLLRYAMALGWIDRDPTAGARGFSSKELHTWTEEEITQFEERWPNGTRERLAFALLLYTGQRGSDVYRMTWANVAGDVIRVAQQKTGTKMVIPLHPNLQAEMVLSRRHHVSILTTAYGKQFSVKGFGNFISEAIGKAALPSRCKAHGLRKAAARRLAEAGCTEKEIAAITGHKTLAEVERYTRAADQERLGRRAIEKQQENAKVANATASVANSNKKA